MLPLVTIKMFIKSLKVSLVTQEKAAGYLMKALVFLSNVAANWILQLLPYRMTKITEAIDGENTPGPSCRRVDDVWSVCSCLRPTTSPL